MKLKGLSHSLHFAFFCRNHAKNRSVCPGDGARIAKSMTGRCQHRVSYDQPASSAFCCAPNWAHDTVSFCTQLILSVCLLGSLPFSQMKGVSEETVGCCCVGREQDLPEPTGWTRECTLHPSRICFSHTHTCLGLNIQAAWSKRSCWGLLAVCPFSFNFHWFCWLRILDSM